jgi:hypothetical protein
MIYPHNTHKYTHRVELPSNPTLFTQWSQSKRWVEGKRRCVLMLVELHDQIFNQVKGKGRQPREKGMRIRSDRLLFL